MRYLSIIAGMCIMLFASCTKHCQNLLDGPINDEEKKFLQTSAHTYLFENQFGDTGYVRVDAPVYKVLPITEDECDRVGNQAVNQMWHLPDGTDFDAAFQHDNGIESSHYLWLSLDNQPVFRYNIIENDFVTIEINTQYFHNTMVDSTANPSRSPLIRTVWYGKHTGILRYEKWNGEIWNRQKALN